jgi:predicted DCC family thiol-disulfide oxidoreductase YuxK
MRKRNNVSNRERQKKNLETIYLSTADLSKFHNIVRVKAKKILHALDNEGNLLLGLDAAYRAWQLVGKGWLYAPLRRGL